MIIALAFTAMVPATNAQDLANIVIKAERVSGNVYMLTGAGGNIGLSIGEDGSFLIDDQFAPLTERILASVAELTPQPVRFVVNTHWHGDHTGGNEHLDEAGAIIVAHDNVRTRMRTGSPEAALPVVTFAESMTFYWNADEVRVVHVGPAHTDGDSIVYFREANVIHMGDTFFNGMYPYIDVSTEGTITGMIQAADTVLGLANDKTKIIPGHGPLGGVKELRASRAMLQEVHGRFQKLIRDGASKEEVIAAKPTRDLDAEWGRGFMKPDRWVGIIYDSMVR